MRLTFGDCVFDSGTREVFRGGRLAPVSPKAFRLLEVLVERRPNAVSKEELYQLLWPGTFVSDANIPNLVGELRVALGDSARKPRILRTVPRFGYAFGAQALPERTREARELAAGDRVYRLLWGRREIALDAGDNLIGRDRDAVVWIDDESVSRRHARVSIAEGGATIEDLDSKNGTFVGGRKLRGPVPLADRDVVKVGPATMTLRVMKQTGSTRSSMKKGSP